MLVSKWSNVGVIAALVLSATIGLALRFDLSPCLALFLHSMQLN